MLQLMPFHAFLMVFAVALLALKVQASPPHTCTSTFDGTPHDRNWVTPDTLVLEHHVEAGRALIFVLPGEIDDRPVATYLTLQAPPLSWLQDRSFVWKTREEDIGEHELLFLARFENESEGIVRVLVEVAP